MYADRSFIVKDYPAPPYSYGPLIETVATQLPGLTGKVQSGASSSSGVGMFLIVSAAAFVATLARV
jgi:hypothetical protein